MKQIWIFAETSGSGVIPAYYELLGKAAALYPTEAEFTAVVFGAEPSAAAEELKNSGVRHVLAVEHAKLAEYHPDYYGRALADLICKRSPDVVFIASTAIGSELAPTVAARVKTGLSSHCNNLVSDEQGELHMYVPAFGGKLMGDIVIPATRPVMASVKPGVFDAVPLPAVPEAEIETLSTFEGAEDGTGIEICSVEPVVLTETPVEKAEVVVCAGLGAAITDNFGKVKELASLLGASTGYTRPVSDLSYAPNESGMIGASGKTVKPRLYLGFGVSGAAQHVCGMKDSGVIINVNSDEEADIFDISNYKAVADCGAVLDALLSQLRG